MASRLPNNVTPLHRGARILGSVDQALIDGARPFIPPEMLGGLNGDDEAVQAIRERLYGPARHRTIHERLCSEAERRDDAPRSRRSFITKATTIFCIAVAAWAALLFAGQMLRGMLS